MKERSKCAGNERKRKAGLDILKTVGILAAAGVFCELMRLWGTDAENYASMIFILAVFMTARVTSGYIPGIVASVIAVLMVNFIFTYPYYHFNFTLTGYPLTILCMLAVSVTTSALMTQMKRSEGIKLESEKEKTRSNLLRAVSHDLRTPLTSILGTTSAVIENDATLTSEQRIKLLNNARDDAQWLIRMVENLLAVTRFESSDDARITKTPEAAEEVVAEAVGKFKKRFPDWQIEVSVPDELLIVPMDPVLIEQVLLNLLENAVLHGSCDRIALTVHKAEDTAVFEVQDNGVGIDPGKLARILETGTGSAAAANKDYKRNMGIGLSVCNTIVKAHGGVMHAFNAKTGGAIFQFDLKIKEE